MKFRRFAALLLVLLMLPALPVWAEEEATPIESAEDLAAMAENPGGSYYLTQDLDMTGVIWKPLDFSGSLDGRGHALLNLTLTQPGEKKPSSYDGNRKDYETTYLGLFGTLSDAQVKDLKLINVRAVYETDEPCFLAGLAGYAENSTISGCQVTGTLELRAHEQMFGVGGIVGYGSGYVEDCQAEVTLITVDTDAGTRDEQFLGGIYATGFMDVKNCRVVIDGYISEHGYVHSGGLVGMYMDYPFGKDREGFVTGNDVKGQITFFEDNTNRRAYCKAIIGEDLVDWRTVERNTEEFDHKEVKDYSKELRPETCPEPEYTETVVAPDCEHYGYTIYTCGGCGYCYMDNYTLTIHTVTNWTVTKEPTTEEEGISQGKCDLCGEVQERTEPKAEPVPTTQAETIPAATQPAPQPETEGPDEEVSGDQQLLTFAAWAVGVLCALALMLPPFLLKRR